MTEATKITIKGEPFFLIPAAEYESLIDTLEDAADAKAVTDFTEALARGEEIALPLAQWERIDAGESPVRVIREYRDLTQQALSEASGIARPEISAIEAGKRRGTVDTLKALAKALKAPLDVIAGE